MSTQITIESFEAFYNDTYNKVLSYTICKCRGLDDVNDIIQEIYTDLYERLTKKKYVEIENVDAYVIGIASKKIKRHYSFKFNKEIKNICIEEIEIIEHYNNIEDDFITKENVEQIWKYLKNKSEITSKIFYLFYILDNSIKEIAEGLQMTESGVKNHLYRTQKELKKYMNGEDTNCLIKMQKK